MENKRKNQSVNDTKNGRQSSVKRPNPIASTKSTADKSIRLEKKQPVNSRTVRAGTNSRSDIRNDSRSDSRKEIKKQYINKPSPTRQVTVDSNQKLNKDGRLNSNGRAQTANANDRTVKKVRTKNEKTVVKKNTKPKKAKSAAFPTFLLFVLSIIVLIGTVSLCIPFITLPKREKKISLQYNMYGEKTKKEVRSGQILKDGKNVYLCLNDFSEKIGLHILGNEENARLYTDKGDTVSIENGSNRALINGNIFELSGNVIIEGKNIYVPATLLHDFADGLEIMYNFSTGKMTVSTIKDDDRSTSITTVYKDFFFTPHEVAPHSPLDNN